MENRGSAQEFYTLEDLMEFDTIANQKPADKLSDRYGFIPTIDVATALYDEGWMARAVREQRVKNTALAGTQKHMIRFAKPEAHYDYTFRSLAHAGLQPELIFFGSHDGSTKFKLFLGFLRFVCFNEMITGDMLEQFCFVHRDKAQVGASYAIQAVNKAIPVLRNQVANMRYQAMSDPAMYAFGKRALELKHGDNWFDTHSTDVWQFVRPTRNEDAHQSVFNVYNRCQEKLFKGEYSYVSTPANSLGGIDPAYHPGINKKAKPVNDLTVTLKLNQGLWQQAQEFTAYVSQN